MDLERYIQRIEQYETGALSAAEQTAFDAELISNPALREALALFRQANDVIEQGVENNLRAQLQEWNQETGQMTVTATEPVTRRVVSRRINWVRMAAAASVALLLGWFGIRWVGSQYADQELFAGQYEKPADSVFRSGATAEHPLQPGYGAWLAGDWPQAARFFGNIPADSEYYAEAQYYLGHTALQQRQYPTALAAFGQAAGRPAAKFKEKAEWNRVLTYLAASRTAEPDFQIFLASIANDPAHSYQAQASILQEKLRSIWR